MGAGMVEHLAEQGWEICCSDPSPQARERVAQEKVQVFETAREAVKKGVAQGIHTVWLMVPQQYVDDVLGEIRDELQSGMTIIDGGNSKYSLAIERSVQLAQHNVQFMDVGVSGGPEGARCGACLMIGGERATYESHENLFRDLAAPEAYQYLGAAGSGHFVKMVHNGIEYGMMQSIAEGFNMVKQSKFDISMKDMARIYQQESVITSRLVGWLARGFEVYGENLDEIDGSVGASGEGQWTVDAARYMNVPVPSIEVALEARHHSQEHPSYLGQLLQTMRNMFGGHVGKTGISS